MVVIWRGYGISAPIVGFGSLLLGQLAADSALGSGYWSGHEWPKGLAFCTAGLLLWLLGRHVNGPLQIRDQTLGNTDLGIRVSPAKHSFFYVPVEWIGGLATVGGLIILMAGMWGST